MSFRFFFAVLVCFFVFENHRVYAEAPGVEVIQSWNFADETAVKDWENRCDLDDVVVDQGVLRARITGNDPFILSPLLDFPARSFQYVEVQLKTNNEGLGEFFFTGNLDGPHGGLSPQKYLTWPVVGDDKWHVYRIYPDWQREGTIKRIRVDFPIPSARNPVVEVRSVRILQPTHAASDAIQPNWNFGTETKEWFPDENTNLVKTANGWEISSATGMAPTLETKLMAFDDAGKNTWISLEFLNKNARSAKIEWVSDLGKVGAFEVPLSTDGKTHWYNIDVASRQRREGKIHWLKISLGKEATASGLVKKLVLSDKPQGPADLLVEQIWFSEPINRAGNVAPLSIRLKNIGGEPASDLAIQNIVLPGNLEVAHDGDGKKFPVVPPIKSVTHTIPLKAGRAGDAEVSVQFSGKGAPEGVHSAMTQVMPNLNLPKADYVPPPKPVRSEYEIGAFYFPGWDTPKRWEPIITTHPERKPVLGWYDEGNPEVIDWQIKWAVENGMQFFLVDWYWSRGHQQLDHWVKGFQKARYRSYLKWAVMWANHNGPGSHSEEDQQQVTQFWIENYFNTPEYYTIGGMPVVMIWTPEGMDADIIAIERAKGNELKRGEGVKKLLDLSRKMAKEAGFKGIYFIAMKWPEASTEAKDIQWLADSGFDMTSIYHYMDHGGEAKNAMRFPFDLVMDSSLKHWQGHAETGILPYLPNLSTGWDSRPWHGEENIIIEDRTVEKFRKICEDYVTFAKQTGVKRFALAPLNEWGEGSYVEPNLEYGFGMYEVLREVFCEKPAEGWPLNYAPADVGLGPYDFP